MPTSCPDETTVERFLSGKLDEPSRRRILTHAAGCDACCELLGALVGAERNGTETEAERTVRGGSGAPHEHALGRGVTLARYRIEEAIGFGGMGVVYSALDPRLDRKVALKVLWEGSPAERERAERLHGEARAMAKLAHPNVVPVFDVGVENGRVFVAMELVEGGTLRKWLATGPHPWREVLARFRQAGEGLAAAHRAGLVHRDFKPENLLVRTDGTVLVTDFGLARAVPPGDPVSTRPNVDDADGTETAGTPVYMAPEQLRGESLDARVDVYAFSVALWEGLYGKRPFELDATEGLLARIAKGPPPPPSDSKVPEGVHRALVRGMSFRRRDRQDTIDELLNECKAAAEEKPAGTKPLVALAVVTIGLLFAGGIAIGRGTSRPTVPPRVETTSARIETPEPNPNDRGGARSAPSALGLATPPAGSGSSLVLAPTNATTAAPTPASSATTARVAPTPAPTPCAAPPPAAIASAPRTPDAGAPPKPAKTERRSTNFEPFGMEAMEAVGHLEANLPSFDACWTETCTDSTCHFWVDANGAVVRAGCAGYVRNTPTPCPASEACMARTLQSLHFAPPPKGNGECSVSLRGR